MTAGSPAPRTFADVYGRPPDGTWRAPGRVNLIGEFTDYNEGFVLPTTLPFATRASVARRDDDLVRVASAQHPDGTSAATDAVRVSALRPGTVAGWPAYALGVFWSLHTAGYALGGADVFVDSEVPIGAGLSSSAALECSVGLAVRELFGLDLSLEQLALAAQRAENEFVGVPCGIMDQMASLLCVPGHALLLDARSLEHRQVPFGLERSGLVLMVLDTRVRHALGDSAYGDRRSACERAAASLGVRALRDVRPEDLGAALARLDDPVLARRVRHVVTEGARVFEVARLLEASRLEDVGPVLTDGHRSLRDDYEVSCAELDTAVDAALRAGALGARMVGGGFGGSAIALVRSGAAGAVAEAVGAAFAAAGFGAPRIFVAAPAAAVAANGHPR